MKNAIVGIISHWSRYNIVSLHGASTRDTSFWHLWKPKTQYWSNIYWIKVNIRTRVKILTCQINSGEWAYRPHVYACTKMRPLSLHLDHTYDFMRINNVVYCNRCRNAFIKLLSGRMAQMLCLRTSCLESLRRLRYILGTLETIVCPLERRRGVECSSLDHHSSVCLGSQDCVTIAIDVVVSSW